ncbi:MAG TPA: outer membrane protein transport protein [Gemmatimonadaceae bacterium]|nr:outer membrane protein transport protein [Gemmatimonadaceae bacterium]
MDLRRLAPGLAALALLAIPAAGRAQGFGLNEIGSCAVGRGFAVTGAPCADASFIYWNPAAGTTQQTRWSILAGLATVAVDGGFIADTTGRVDRADVPMEIPPHLFVNYGGGRWAAGLGVYVPYGLTSQWKPDFPGRFSALKARIASVYVQPNVSFEVIPGRVSIGGGPVFGHSTVELRQSIDLSTQALPVALPGITSPTFANVGVAAGSEFAQANLEGDANAWGFNLGVHIRLTPTIQLGVRYLSQLDFEYEGADADFSPVATGLVVPAAGIFPLVPAGTPYDAVVASAFTTTLVDQQVNTRIDHPAQAQVGLSFALRPSTTLEVDAAWIGWSSFKELPIDFSAGSQLDDTLIEDYEDSWSYRTGIEHRFASGVAGRLGFSAVQTPVPDETVTPLLPDADRLNFNVGFSLPLGPRTTFDFAYLRVQPQSRRGRIVERTDRTFTAEDLNSGAYYVDANVFSFSLKASF